MAALIVSPCVFLHLCVLVKCSARFELVGDASTTESRRPSSNIGLPAPNVARREKASDA